MHVPGIPSWMKERNHLICGGIEGMGFVVLATVTSLAGEREVVFRAFAALTFRKDMFDGMPLCGAEFRADAVFAIPMGASPDQSLHVGWNALLSHAAQV